MLVRICASILVALSSHECCHPSPLHRTRGMDLLYASALLAFQQKPVFPCWCSVCGCVLEKLVHYNSQPGIYMSVPSSPFLSHIQKLLGNSLLKLEGDDRLDINCTLPLTDQVSQIIFHNPFIMDRAINIDTSDLIH